MIEDTKIKDVPMVLPCGSTVVKGMKIFTVQKLNVSSYVRKDEVKSFSGNSAVKIIEHTVISVNQASTARTFTVRSDRGCEQTYAVRNNCLPDLFGKKSLAIAKAKELHEKDIARVQEKLDWLELHYRDHKQKFKSTIKKLKAIKFAVDQE